MTEMIGALLAALRPVFAMILIGGAATLMVAPAFDMAAHQRAASQAASRGAAPAANHPDATPQPSDDPDADPTDAPTPDFDTLLRECLDTRDPDSDACAAAALESGMSYEDFRAKIVAKLAPEPTKKPEPKAEPTKKPETVVVKKTEPVKTSNDFSTWFEKCLNTRDFNSDECLRAEELSGLGTADFEAKFNAKLAAKDGGDFWVWFDKCLGSRDWRSDTCVRAQELIGFNDEDFHAKFERYLAERDAQASKTSKTPTPTTAKPSLVALVTLCGETHLRASESCRLALTLSGIKPDEFYAKVEAKFGKLN
jgi:hypothetical protein